MRINLIATFGALAHENFPRYSYCPAIKADHWNCQEDVCVDLPEKYIAGKTVLDDILVKFAQDGPSYPLSECITNRGDQPALAFPNSSILISLKVIED